MISSFILQQTCQQQQHVVGGVYAGHHQQRRGRTMGLHRHLLHCQRYCIVLCLVIVVLHECVDCVFSSCELFKGEQMFGTNSLFSIVALRQEMKNLTL